MTLGVGSPWCKFTARDMDCKNALVRRLRFRDVDRQDQHGNATLR